MRNETEVIHELLQFAQDDRVRAVLMNGSRVNPNVTKDLFCDYDVIFVVRDPKFYVDQQEWISSFGQLVMMQQNVLRTESEDEYIFLMLFKDGVRIDLSFRRMETINQHFQDSLTKVLLDKDNGLKSFEPPSDKSYVTRKPAKDDFDQTINDILWCSTNAVKGLWRDELPYVTYMMDIVIKQGVMKLLSWYVGMNHNWNVNTGTALKWLKKFLPEELWVQYLKTHSGPEYPQRWAALFETIALTRTLGEELALHLNYLYPEDDHNNVVAYLEQVQALPKDAQVF
ncbi:aminoglycoside 6-adenylyltransferase [Paenibacillus sp. sgz500958]|uniref:aminoglycoside 6-adenylyltransferase n=1 Tax=Paenibacillus sp. sgz500958 TaxID=3242475 RepID=UPI0036D3B0F9